MESKPLYEFGHFLLDPSQRILLREGERVHLHPKTFLILQTLVEANGDVVSKDDLMAKVWPDVVVEENNLTKNMSLLRKAMGNGSESAEFIETIPKVGYRFRAEALIVQKQNGLVKNGMAAAVQEDEDRAQKSGEARVTEVAPASRAVKSVRLRRLWVGLVVAVAIGAAVVGWRWIHPRPTVGEFAPVRLTYHVANDSYPVYSPDGRKIAFTSNRDGLPAIYLMNVDGSEARKISGDSLECFKSGWSADGKTLFWAKDVARGQEATYEVNIDGSGLAKRPYPHGALSPDGKKIALLKRLVEGSAASIEIFVADADGRNAIRLTNNGRLDTDPAWSPDGQRIAFTCFPDGFVDGGRNNAEICVMNADGSNTIRLTNDMDWDNTPSWSPDGMRIAFHSSRNCKSGEAIYVMNADGSNVMRLTECQNIVFEGGWSPDSKRIVYAADRDGNPEIYSINADPSHQTNLTHHPAEDTEPVWSSDGIHIAFISNRDGKHGLFVMDANGANPRKLAGNVSSRLSWSLDGRRIVFAADWAGKLDVYAVKADGSHIIRLTHGPENQNYPVWSPDGARVLFSYDVREIAQLFVMNADGSGVARISNSPVHEFQQDWSPDGRQIVFTRSRDRGAQRDIWMMNADGGNPRLIAAAPGNDEFINPRFSPDGQCIAYQRRATSPLQTDVWAMNADGSGQTRLTHLSGASPAWSPDGKRIAFHSCRRTGNCDIYVMDVAGK